MATLVLSTVGTALGGPVGSAIGALIGQSIDQQLLAPVRRGPRVGDLSVQTSSYGTQIPRIYGAMRVAGTVVWATDLVENSQTTGAKGQPDVMYSYSVSLAVALSSRRAKSIGRIWADGNLLRGTAGDFKVDTQFRFLDGSEDQLIDPLIGSVEGIASTPAYRGVALAVFENLQLAAYGNRIPMMTFEVLADEDPPGVGAIIADASDDLIASDSDDRILGYAAYGRSIRSAVQPLVDCFAVELFDDGAILRSPESLASSVLPAELGSSADGKQLAQFQRDQIKASELPSHIRVTFYDPSRDYQSGEALAAVGEQMGSDSQRDLPAVLSAADAKAVAHSMIARSWSERDRLTVRLPPNRLAIEPGNNLKLQLSPPLWRVDKTTVDGFAVIAELRPAILNAPATASDGGRIVQEQDIVAEPLKLALFDVPTDFSGVPSDPMIVLAASSASGWVREPISLSFGSQTLSTEPAHQKSILGRAEGALGPGSAELLDAEASVTVVLEDPDQWLVSCDDEALANGANLAAIGSELVQFGNALALGGGRFRLSRLLRGRGGSEWACSSHSSDEPFCLLKPGTVQPLALPRSSIGATITATARGGGASAISFLGENLRPPAPVHLRATSQLSGELSIGWTRRSRNGFAWVDGMDAPLGEAREQYSVNIAGAAGALEFIVGEPSLTVAPADVALLGAGAATVEVRQIGDLAISRPGRLILTIS